MKEEKKELHKEKDTTCVNSSKSEIEEKMWLRVGSLLWRILKRMLSFSRRFWKRLQRDQKKRVLLCKRVWMVGMNYKSRPQKRTSETKEFLWFP